MSATVVVLAGGTGGAKLARGMLDVVGGDRLSVIANTGDDIDIYGANVSPDPDLVAFWLADRIDERGWGLRDDTFAVMDALRELGVDVWFNLGDRDLAWCLERRRLRDEEDLGPTAALERLLPRIGVTARVLPMSDDPVHTWVRRAGEWRPFQEFMIRHGARGPVEGVEFRGASQARATPAVLAAIEAAEAIVIGPSNPIISIGPILAVPDLREALRTAAAPVIAVSPIVDGEVVKGPTADFLAHAGVSMSADGIAELYDDVLDAVVADTPVDGLPVLRTDVLMPDARGRRRLADETLRFALGLS